jgi:hypothetical protein
VWEGITIAHRIFVDDLRSTDDLDGIDRVEAEDPPDVGQEFVKPAEAIPILTAGGRLGAIAEFGGHRPVQEIGAGFVRLV